MLLFSCGEKIAKILRMITLKEFVLVDRIEVDINLLTRRGLRYVQKDSRSHRRFG